MTSDVSESNRRRRAIVDVIAGMAPNIFSAIGDLAVYTIKAAFES